MLSRVFSISLLMFLMWVASASAGNPVFYALNTSAAAPPNVTGLAALEDTTTTMLLFWTSGGGNTASFRISYQSGATAPANCTAGTQVSEATVGSSTNYIVTGLTSNTQYSFRVCAANSSSVYASGVTVTIKTPPSQPVFRSMGFNSTTAKATGGANAMTISGSIATFATGLANNIGVGDAIQYSSANNATIDKIAFIHGRLSSTQFLVKTAAGSAAPFAVSGNTSWSLYRSYTNLNNVVSGTENASINATVKNFDSWTGGANLPTLGATWYVECYADAAHAGTYTNIGSGWTTGANNKLIFTTPWETRHVGARQRHVGAWSTSYFYATVTDNSVLEVDISNVVIEGIQFKDTANASDWFGPIMIGAAVTIPASSVVEINNNIIEIVNSSAAFRDVAGIYTLNPNTGLVLYATNNIIKCTGTVGSNECAQGIRGTWTSNDAASWSAYIYNNTVVGAWQYGIDFFNSGAGNKTVYVKNNIVQGVRYSSYESGAGGTTYAAGSGYNISGNGTATGSTGDKVNAAVSFVNAAAMDYHLAAGDTAAKDAGTNLSTDPFYPISIDIDTVTRSGTWDIGADEY